MIKKIKEFFHIIPKNTEPNVFERFDNLFSNKLDEDIIRIELGEDLINFGERMCQIIENLRNKICEEKGIIFPIVRIIENESLQENQYEVFIRGKNVFIDYAVPNDNWLEEVFPQDFKKIINNNLPAIFTNKIVEKYIETVQKNNNMMITEITNWLSTSEIRRILLDIIERGKSIREIAYIFEKIDEQVFIENRFNFREPHKIAEEIIKAL